MEPFFVPGAALGQFLAQIFAFGLNARVIIQIEGHPKLIRLPTGAAIDVGLVDILAPDLRIGLHVLADGKKAHAGNILVHAEPVNLLDRYR